jgi:hypothetical protein
MLRRWSAARGRNLSQNGNYRFAHRMVLLHAKNPQFPPKYRHHKASGQAIVHLNGKDIYLGPYNSPASHTLYDRLVAEWLVEGRNSSRSGPRDERFVVAKPQVHAVIRRRLDRPGNCARATCTNHLVPQHRPAGETPIGRRSPLVRGENRRIWLVPQHPHAANPWATAPTAGKSHHQLFCRFATGRFRHGRAGFQRSLAVRFPRHG